MMLAKQQYEKLGKVKMPKEKYEVHKWIVCPDCSGAGTIMKSFYLIDPSDSSDSEVACETCTPDNHVEDSGEGFIFVDWKNKKYSDARLMKAENLTHIPDDERWKYLKKTLYRN